jgi:toxin ParE1/3/4
MASFRIAATALSDLRRIGRYTLDRWGAKQASHYLGSLDDCFRRLAEQPELGKSAEDIRPGLWRMCQGHHVVFFRRTHDGIRVIRVLHERMLPQGHLANCENDE